MIKSDVVKAMEMEREMLAFERLAKRQLDDGRYALANISTAKLNIIRDEYQSLTGVRWQNARRKLYK